MCRFPPTTLSWSDEPVSCGGCMPSPHPTLGLVIERHSASKAVEIANDGSRENGTTVMIVASDEQPWKTKNRVQVPNKLAFSPD